MSWDVDGFWSKARVFLEYAFDCDREDPRFGLWCAMGLELLARASVSSVSPTLLAAPDPDHTNLLHVLSLPRSDASIPKTLPVAKVLDLCVHLFPDFSPADLKAARILTGRRNEELHTATPTFGAFTTSQWIPGFYRCCRSLCSALNKSLSDLLGSDEADIATELLKDVDEKNKRNVNAAIAQHRNVFLARSDPDRATAAATAQESARDLAYKRHHRVTCPACECEATVQGTAFGPQKTVPEVAQIIVKQAVLPHTFSCTACSLNLTGFTELEAAGLGDQYTRTTTYAPGEYYELIDPEDADAIEALVADYHRDEYDNQ